MQEETNGKNNAQAKDINNETSTLGIQIIWYDIFSYIQAIILVEEQEPRKKAEENNNTKSHISTLSNNKWSLLGVMVLIVAVLYPFKIFYD